MGHLFVFFPESTSLIVLPEVIALSSSSRFRILSDFF
jgi:hypothetical protein